MKSKSLRLEVPSSLGIARPSAEGTHTITRPEPNPLSGGAVSWPEAAHRYHLQPRQQQRVTGKRSGANLDPPEATEPKRLRQLTDIPMEISAVLTKHMTNPWYTLAIGVLLGIVYMSLIVVILN